MTQKYNLHLPIYNKVKSLGTREATLPQTMMCASFVLYYGPYATTTATAAATAT